MAGRKMIAYFLAQLRPQLAAASILLLFAVVIPSCRSETEVEEVGGVEITLYSSSTKEDWLNAVTAAFNQEQIKTGSGKPIAVRVFHVNSGRSQQDILHGEIEPTVWSPGDMSWVEGANQQWQAQTGKPLISENCRSTVLEPTGIAMWRPMAEAMGWPASPIYWSDLLGLAADPDGWARYGHPEWGRFRLGLTNPETSNSGLLILTSLTYAVLGRTRELSPELVAAPPVAEAFRQISLHTVEFGEQSARLLESMVLGGSAHLHAINTNEAETLKSNARYGKYLPFPLAFIIPADGTIWGDHPYCILDASWVSAEQHEAAALFAAYLLQPEQQQLAVERGLRPANFSVELGSPISTENGANPAATTLTVPALESPPADAAQAIIELFIEVTNTVHPDQSG
jgi:Ca-activated chloride channel homolog